MIYHSSLHVWAIVRRLPQMQRVIVSRFRKREDAESYLRIVRRHTLDGDFVIVFDPAVEDNKSMPRKEHNKLVRDRIPEILENQNVRFSVEEMTLAEYRQALRQKLIEEAQEVATATDANLAAEIADLWEVIDATLNAYQLRREDVLARQMQRRIDRGSFNRRLRLLWTEI
ncbi:MAG: nucleoside triphosphate pyrophosphohydrolase [Leptolyngbyaceae bacterium]|nr:nucleoside triphosphate pyrophosphohydrolase [Leptolyngbyaceae bacterium]